MYVSVRFDIFLGRLPNYIIVMSNHYQIELLNVYAYAVKVVQYVKNWSTLCCF